MLHGKQAPVVYGGLACANILFRHNAGPDPDPFNAGPDPAHFDAGLDPDPFEAGPDPDPFDAGLDPTFYRDEDPRGTF